MAFILDVMEGVYVLICVKRGFFSGGLGFPLIYTLASGGRRGLSIEIVLIRSVPRLSGMSGILRLGIE